MGPSPLPMASGDEGVGVAACAVVEHRCVGRNTGVVSASRGGVDPRSSFPYMGASWPRLVWLAEEAPARDTARRACGERSSPCAIPPTERSGPRPHAPPPPPTVAPSAGRRGTERQPLCALDSCCRRRQPSDAAAEGTHRHENKCMCV